MAERRGKAFLDTAAVTARLGRYADLVGDWSAFVSAMVASRPTCMVANRPRLSRDHLAALCRAEGLPVDEVGWTRDALRVPPDVRPGRWWPHQAGLFQVQEEASLLPVHVLAPRPGERVLDLCAAPGGKAAQIAVSLGRTGTVVANDKSGQRLAGMRDKAKRLGLLNLTMTVHDGADFPVAAGPFDAVLADVPCSGEGTQFAEGASFATQDKQFRHKLTGQQRALLRRALRLVRPGGRVVYATCSLAPEENEAVVDAILREQGEAVRLVPLHVPGLSARPGLTAWAEQAFLPELSGALRLWPQDTGTGGFFVALLQRTDGSDPDAHRRAMPDAAALGAPATIESDLATLRKHFGLPADTFDGLKFHVRGDEVHATAADHLPAPRPRTAASGIPFLKRAGRWPKPTTAAAMWLGGAATRNVIDLDRDQRTAYQARREFVASAEQIRKCPATGYVLLRYAGLTLGAAFLTDRDPPRVRSEFPRIWVPTIYRDRS